MEIFHNSFLSDGIWKICITFIVQNSFKSLFHKHVLTWWLSDTSPRHDEVVMGDGEQDSQCALCVSK